MTDYLWNEMMKANQMLAADRLNELIDQFMLINKDAQFNKTEVDKTNDVSKNNAKNMQHTLQLNLKSYTENKDILKQSGKGKNDKCRWNIKPQNLETVVTRRPEKNRMPDRLCYD